MYNVRKNSSSSENEEIGVGSKKFQESQLVVVELGLKLQQDPDRSSQFHHHRHHHHHDGDGSYGGPTSNTPTNTIYNSSLSSTTSTSTSSVSGGVLTGVFQPFDVSSSSSSSSSYYSSLTPFFKSSGGMATTTMEYPFTATQWKELERQAMIYKYMMASLPVPHDLLYCSFTPNFSASSTFAPASYFMGKYGSGISMRWSGNNKDAEPGRCRRTDGKKWRCSRDVAPNQKYCERHMHRGRPRSRKHVELQQQQQQNHHSSVSNLSYNNNNNISSKDKDSNAPTKKARLSGAIPSPNNNSHYGVGSNIVQPCSKVSFFDHPFDDSRNFGWNDEQQWSQLVGTNMNSTVFQHQFEEEPLNLNSHDGMGLLERPLIDAWSSGNNKASLSCSNGGNNNVNANAIDDEMCQIHMGLGLIDSWVGSSTTTLGGPLAEVLRPGNLAMSDGLESELVTPPATAVSSPSGVLQKAFATLSDSSGSTSPTTCHNSKANSDMPFHWLN